MEKKQQWKENYCIDNSCTIVISFRMMKPRIKYSEEKNLLLKETRGLCFEDVIQAIENGNILDDLEHHDKKKYPKQRILVIKIRNYACAVLYIVDKRKEAVFLKTVYPSRVLTKKYLRKQQKV